MKHIILYCILLAFLASACRPLEHVQSRRDSLLAEYRALIDYEKLPVRVLSWQQALRLMDRGNIELQQARHQQEEAHEQEKRIWREWIPTLNFGQYYNRALFSNTGTAGASSSQFSYNVIFNLPSVMQMPMRKYTAALASFKARKDIELKQRELTAKLYQLFRQAEFRERRQALEKSHLQQDSTHHDTWLQEEREDWLKMAALLNDYSARWKVLPGDAPRVSLDDYLEQLKAPSELTIVQMALQTEASRLRQVGVLLQFWPQVQIDFYSPTLFTSSGGQLGGFMKNGRDTRVNMNSYIMMDTQGQNTQAYKSAKQNHELLVQNLRHRMWEYKEKAAAVADSWRKYEDWKKAVEAYRQFRMEHGAETPEELLAIHSDSMLLQQEIEEQEKLNLERICCLVQEYGLPPFANESDPPLP